MSKASYNWRKTSRVKKGVTTSWRRCRVVSNVVIDEGHLLPRGKQADTHWYAKMKLKANPPKRREVLAKQGVVEGVYANGKYVWNPGNTLFRTFRGQMKDAYIILIDVLVHSGCAI